MEKMKNDADEGRWKERVRKSNSDAVEILKKGIPVVRVTSR